MQINIFLRKANDIDILLHKYQSSSEATQFKCALIDAHIFSGCTVNPGARTGPHSDFLSPLGYVLRALWLVNYFGAMSSLKPHGE